MPQPHPGLQHRRGGPQLRQPPGRSAEAAGARRAGAPGEALHHHLVQRTEAAGAPPAPACEGRQLVRPGLLKRDPPGERLLRPQPEPRVAVRRSGEQGQQHHHPPGGLQPGVDRVLRLPLGAAPRPVRDVDRLDVRPVREDPGSLGPQGRCDAVPHRDPPILWASSQEPRPPLLADGLRDREPQPGNDVRALLVAPNPPVSADRPRQLLGHPVVDMAGLVTTLIHLRDVRRTERHQKDHWSFVSTHPHSSVGGCPFLTPREGPVKGPRRAKRQSKGCVSLFRPDLDSRPEVCTNEAISQGLRVNNPWSD